MLPRPRSDGRGRGGTIEAMDQKLAMLSKVPLFAGLSSHDLTELGRLVDEVDVKQGKVLAQEGAPGHEFFVIIEGTIAISKGDKHLRDLGPGDHFGELAMIAKVPRTATAIASTPATLLVLGHREFSEIRGDDVVELKRMLHALGFWRPELAEFPEAPNFDADRSLLTTDPKRFEEQIAAWRERATTYEERFGRYDAEAIAAVDAFRRAHGLAFEGNPAGLVDARLVTELRRLYLARPGR